MSNMNTAFKLFTVAAAHSFVRVDAVRDIAVRAPPSFDNSHCLWSFEETKTKESAMIKAKVVGVDANTGVLCAEHFSQKTGYNMYDPDTPDSISLPEMVIMASFARLVYDDTPIDDSKGKKHVPEQRTYLGLIQEVEGSTGFKGGVQFDAVGIRAVRSTQKMIDKDNCFVVAFRGTVATINTECAEQFQCQWQVQVQSRACKNVRHYH